MLIASAGGGLALAMLVALRDNGEQLPAAAVCISPWTDLVCASESWDTNVKYDVFGDEASVKRSAKMYLGNVDPRTPLASPLYADLAGLPPLFLQAGTKEALLADSTRFAEKAHQAGVDVSLDLWDDLIHGWQYAANVLPEGKAAVEKISEFIRHNAG